MLMNRAVPRASLRLVLAVVPLPAPHTARARDGVMVVVTTEVMVRGTVQAMARVAVATAPDAVGTTAVVRVVLGGRTATGAVTGKVALGVDV